MRILHIVPTYLPAVRYGGPIYAVHGLCRALAARGHDVRVFTTDIDGPNSSPVPLGIPVLLDGVSVTYYPSRFMRRLSWAPAMATAIAREIAGFDVVHNHSVFLWPTWIGSRAARKAHKPYVLSPRGALVGHLIKRRNRLIKTAWIELIEKRNLRQAAAIHVTSNVEASELRRLGWDMPPLHVIPNGIDEASTIGNAEPSSDMRRIVERQPLVLFFGRLSWVKGLDRLLQAFALTRESNLAIVGTDDEGIVPQLSELARSLGIAERVHFLPRTVRGADKDAVFAAAKLFVLASYSENFGNVVLEAMQQGVPVIVTPEIGAADVVKRAEGGLVVEGTPTSLAEAITRLTQDPDLARAMGEQGRRYVSANCTWDRIAAEMEALYASLLPTSAESRC